MRHALSLLLTLALATPASATPVFEVHIGPWTVTSGDVGCMAQNRPTTETADLPINTTVLFRKLGGEIQLIQAFWPGALTEADNTMTLLITGKGSADLPAQPQLDPWVVLRSKTLPPEVIDKLKGGPPAPYTMVVKASASGAQTLVDIQDLPRVLAELDRCTTIVSDSYKAP